MRYRTYMLTFTTGIVCATLASSQDAPPQGCFCLADTRLSPPQVQKGCVRVPKSSTSDWQAICTFRDQQDNLVVSKPLALDLSWQILSAKHPDCMPCEPQSRETDTVPRGDEDTDVVK